MRVSKKFVDFPFEYHQEIELEILTLTNLGLGLGRVELPKTEDLEMPTQWVVMVPFALPGERIKARVFRNYKNYSEADLIEVLVPSPHRVKPACPLFGVCGGCQYQNMAYSEQLQWKTKHLAELLKKLAGIDFPVNPTHPSPKAYHYRSKLTPHYPTPKAELPLPIGFLHHSTRNYILDVPNCPIATEAINEALPAVRQKLIENLANNPKKRGGTILLRHSVEGVTTYSTTIITEQVNEQSFHFLAGDFFQNNPFILPEFVSYIIQKAKSPKTRFLVDAYCGVGLFGISGSRLFDSVLGIEVNPSAIAFANENKELNKAHNCHFLLGQAEKLFSEVQFPANETAVILDPPRKGCDAVFLEQLIAFSPERIVYVSCDPSTQARDLNYLLAHTYAIEEVQPFDLFPQTRHIESVITLVKTS